MKLMNAEELRAAHAAQNWRVLWEQTIYIVKHAVTRLLQAGQLAPERASDDLLQEGYMAAGKAVKTWNPDLGMFSTWISHAVRGAMLNHLKAESTGIIGGRDAGLITTQLADDITPDMEGDEPTEEIERLKDAVRVRIALGHLEERERLILERWFGIDCEPEPMDAICMVVGLKRVQVWRIIKNTLRRMKHMM